MQITMNTSTTFPYQEIIGDLVASTMRAQAVLVSAHSRKEQLNDLHGDINKQFSWLVLEYKEGSNRHFFDTPGSPIKPLRVKALRYKKAIPAAILKNLTKRRAPDAGIDIRDMDKNEIEKFWQKGLTRISNLIMSAFIEDIKFPPKDSRKKGLFSIRSPLSIVYDFLTIPEHMGSRAYALLATRNFLFNELQIIPNLKIEEGVFTVHDIEFELSSVWTSLRPRHDSKGADKPPVGSNVTALVRHFLAMKGILRFCFSSVGECKSYLRRECLSKKRTKKSPFPLEVERSPRLEKLPEVGEIVNELFGLPLPIRGADTIFCGGMKFSSRGGIVMAFHGGPGCGKTSLALAFGAYLAPFGIRTLFITGEEDSHDLKARLTSLVPESIRRLSFFGEDQDAFTFVPMERTGDADSKLDLINTTLSELKNTLAITSDHKPEGFHIPKPCRAIVVLDGLHDFFADKTKRTHTEDRDRAQVDKLYKLIGFAKASGTLVILTTGSDWSGDAMLDYLVDVAIKLSHDSIDQYGAKPDRRLRLLKARHQLCAPGTHGIQIAGGKGLRFSPQINYQLDRRLIWKVAFPNQNIFKKALQNVVSQSDLKKLINNGSSSKISKLSFSESIHAPKIFCESHVFINGQGSGGKAAIALKIAMSPSFEMDSPNTPIARTEKVLVVSFLYPKEYYEKVFGELKKIIVSEYSSVSDSNNEWQTSSRMEMIRFYPGLLKPNNIYNRIEWELESADLYGDPYTCVIIDGIHNVFLQFPEIQDYKLLWPQIYNSLRSRSIMIITTHTTLSIPRAIEANKQATPSPPVDDNRSEPLRHALVQKSDFQFEVDPVPADRPPYNVEELSSLFALRTISAIGQPTPKKHLLWSREASVLIEAP